MSGMIEDFSKLRVTVMGLGRFGGGVGVTRWLARQGAKVTVSDQAGDDELKGSIEQLADHRVAWHLGGHKEDDFRDTDLVVANPAVRHDSPFLQVARDAGVPITTEMNLFVERCPARCVGITGSVGKSTITSMVGHVLRHAQHDFGVYIGGNIGGSLLDELPHLSAGDVIVLELSSFQLHWTPAVEWSPHIAVVTNVTPNHLDWHGSFNAYLADKLNIVRFQDPQRDAIVIEENDELRKNFELMFGDISGIWRYGVEGNDLVANMQSTPGVDCDDRQLCWEGVALLLPGEHNRANAAAALTVAQALGVPDENAVAALAKFEGLPHRLERVAAVGDVTYFNDSKSTTPEAVATALDAIESPVLIIIGGYDKQIDLTPAVNAVAAGAKYAACIGQTGLRLMHGIQTRGGTAEYFATFREAVQACRARAKAGDAVLLSPGCASWDMFEDYRARGEEFTRLVQEFEDELAR